MEDQLIASIADLDEEKTLSLVDAKIRAGHSYSEIMESCRRGVEIVGQRYGEGHYFLADLIMSEEIFKAVVRLVEPLIEVNTATNGVSIVLGTIEGDIHNLGKDIVAYLLRSVGFRVNDLGVDVAPEKFVQAVNETGASILGISILLTSCIGSIKKVVDLLQESGLRDRVQIIVGGYPVSQLIKEFTGADYIANEASQGLEICMEILRGGKKA